MAFGRQGAASARSAIDRPRIGNRHLQAARRTVAEPHRRAVSRGEGRRLSVRRDAEEAPAAPVPAESVAAEAAPTEKPVRRRTRKPLVPNRCYRKESVLNSSWYRSFHLRLFIATAHRFANRLVVKLVILNFIEYSRVFVVESTFFLLLLHRIHAANSSTRLDGNTYLDGRAIRLGNFTPVHVMLESRKD